MSDTNPPDALWLNHQALISLQRLKPRLQACFTGQAGADWPAFERRLNDHFPRLFHLLYQLYGRHYDFFYHLECALQVATGAWLARPPELKALDAEREAAPEWYQSNRMLGAVCYVDLFAGSLAGLRQKIPYFKELGLSYLHLMPLFKCPAGDSDGGYAVSSYREVNPALGSMDELRALAGELRRAGISLVVDFIFNHTSHEHEWARRAIAGEAEFRDYYYVFPDRTMPDAYERTLREIFPDEHPGAFTFSPALRQWVWTTFHSYQWDLNYSNPAVFTAMADEMLFLANAGVSVLRLDAVAFIWKQMGTSCENLPMAHTLIQAFNSLRAIAAPALLFKSEAIVHPDEVVKYIGADECQLSYNPLLMALLWNSLATRKVRLLSQAMRDRFSIAPGGAWVNYVRVHDDIGWTFSDEDAALLGVKASDHRRFLNQFYTGRFAGSFARGLPFQENPKTGDCRISGTCASLAGLEQALAENGPEQALLVEHAIARILLIHSIILSIGGLPLIYLGDEIGTLNDYRYRDDPAKAGDSRWVHRPYTDWSKVERRNDLASLEGRIFGGLRRIIQARLSHPELAGGAMQVIDTGNEHVFAYLRHNAGQRALILTNFADQEQTVASRVLQPYRADLNPADWVTGEIVALDGDLKLKPHQFVWLKA
jgi:amylosucrase